MKKLSIIIFLFFPLLLRSQTSITVSPHLGVGLSDYGIGSLQVGVTVDRLQQLSIGPFLKQYQGSILEKTITPQLYGLRLYSRTNLVGGIGAIVVLDVIPKKQLGYKGMRVEQTIGLNYMFNNHLGVDVGMNFEEYNPLWMSTEPGKLSIRFVYDIFVKRF